jgi:hypothetical protein
MNGMALLDSPDRLIAKAWADEDFKSALLANPRAALRGQGIEIPEGVTLNVLENTENVINLVLPKPPELPLVEESLDQLEVLDRCGCGGGRCGGGCGGACACIICSCIS